MLRFGQFQSLHRVVAHCCLVSRQPEGPRQRSQRVGFVIDDQKMRFEWQPSSSLVAIDKLTFVLACVWRDSSFLHRPVPRCPDLGWLAAGRCRCGRSMRLQESLAMKKKAAAAKKASAPRTVVPKIGRHFA